MSTTIHLAHTVPVNPPGATPVLSAAQVFAGFQRKIRRPWDFVPAIEKSEVLSDEGGVVKRRVTFNPAPPSASGVGGGGAVVGHPAEVIEVCTELAPNRVDYELENGSTVLNIISTGSSGNPEDLYVTYAFAWKHAGMEVGSAAYKEAEANHKKVAKLAVESSVATTRKLVGEGEIQ